MSASNSDNHPLKKKYHHGGLREQLLKVALQLIADEGVEQLTFARLASACGVTRSAFYRHFDNKHQLLVTLAIQGYDQLAAELIGTQQRFVGQGQALLKAVGTMYVHFATNHPALYKLMFATEAIRRSQDTHLRAASKKTFDVLLDLIAQMSSRPMDSTSCRITALAAWSLVHGYAMLKLSQRVDRVLEAPGEDVVGQLLSHFVV